MKKRMIIIPHAIWAILLIILTVFCYSIHGGSNNSFIEPWTFPLLFLLMFPLPTSISALGIMIISRVKIEKEHTSLLIASGIIGSVVLFFYLILFIGIASVPYNGFIAFSLEISFFVSPFLAAAIWILLIIYHAKLRKDRKQKISDWKFTKSE